MVKMMFMLIYGVKVSIISLLAVFLTEKLLVAQTELVLEEESDVTKLLLEPSQRVSSEPRVNEILRMIPSSVKSGVETELSTELEGKIDQDHRRLLQTNNPPLLEESLGDSETNQAKSPLNNLNQSGNSLMFPTKPKEVEITINKPLTLNEVIAITLQNNRELENARIEVEEIQARLIEQRSALYPSLRIDSRLNRRFVEVESADFVRGEVIPNRVVEVRETTGIFGVSLLYDIYTGGKRDGLIRRAELEIRDRQLQLEQIAEQVRFEAADNYYRLQNADAQVAIAEADVENASRTLRDAKLLKQAGVGTKLDVLRADGDLEAANARLTRAIAEQRIARRTLAETMSLGQQFQIVAADEISDSGSWDLSLEETIVLAYQNRAELEQQLIQREIGEQDRRIAIAGVIPQLDFQADYGFDDDFDNSLGALVNYRFEARLTWEFFDGGKAFAGARSAERRIDQANSQFADLRNQIRLEVETAYYSLMANQENIESTRKNVVTREEALRLARLSFQAGVVTQTDVIDTQRDLSEARGEFLQAIIQYNQSLNALQRAVSNFPDNRLFQIR